MKKKISNIDFTILKIFISIVLISTFVAMLLFMITFLGLAFIMSNQGDVFPNNPRGVMERISQNFSVVNDETGKPISFVLEDETLLPEEDWCILLNENGDIIWSLNKPVDIPDHYSLNDIARISKWFLSDYPVYMRTENYGLFILGIPKNTVGKYSIEFTMDWFDTLPIRIFRVFILNFAVAALLSSLFGSFLYKKIRLLTEGLVKLRREEAVSLPARGIFKEPFSNITRTSQALARKNALLANRDRARSNWISGISHDIRTPLSMVVGYGGQLAEDPTLSGENRKYAAIITAQGMKIKKLIEDLNLISSLEYEMQPRNKKPLQIAILLRGVVSEVLNSGLLASPDSQTLRSSLVSPPEERQLNSGLLESPDSQTLHSSLVSPPEESESAYDISLLLDCEQAMILGDESLLTRAFYNLLQNSVAHNEKGCRITVSGSLQAECVLIMISDNGQGVPEKVLENLDTLPSTAHGFGLPMSYRIIRAHGGTFEAKNEGGFVVTIRLPLFIP